MTLVTPATHTKEVIVSGRFVIEIRNDETKYFSVLQDIAKELGYRVDRVTPATDTIRSYGANVIATLPDAPIKYQFSIPDALLKEM